MTCPPHRAVQRAGPPAPCSQAVAPWDWLSSPTSLIPPFSLLPYLPTCSCANHQKQTKVRHTHLQQKYIWSSVTFWFSSLFFCWSLNQPWQQPFSPTSNLCRLTLQILPLLLERLPVILPLTALSVFYTEHPIKHQHSRVFSFLLAVQLLMRNLIPTITAERLDIWTNNVFSSNLFSELQPYIFSCCC